jgi:hypothetical protein
LAVGFSSFEVLTYRWGVATVVLLLFGFLAGRTINLFDGQVVNEVKI